MTPIGVAWVVRRQGSENKTGRENNLSLMKDASKHKISMNPSQNVTPGAMSDSEIEN